MWERETTGLALVAERQGQVVGVIAVAAIPYLEREGRWGRIVALVVSTACRGQGIGRRLVDAAEEAAGELGCVTMEVTSRRSRTESHPFYRNLDYEDCSDRSARYLKDLVPGASAVSHGTSFPRHRDPRHQRDLDSPQRSSAGRNDTRERHASALRSPGR
jgi:ribosomal protein S18 acetylase RimI-like enzyme